MDYIEQAMALMPKECPACGQGEWKATNPVVNGYVTGCLCAPQIKFAAYIVKLFEAQQAEKPTRAYTENG